MKEFTAHVDLATGEIHGCEKGSYKWWHEKGHLEFNSNPKFSYLLMVKDWLFTLWTFIVMLAIMYRPFVWVAAAIFMIRIYIGFYEERWCNSFATKKIKQIRESKDLNSHNN